MKTLLISIAAFLFIQIVSHAAEDAVLPDFSKVYPEEKIAHKLKIQGVENYTYQTNLTFDEWKQGMVKFLAEGWKDEKISDEELKLISAPLKGQGMEISGVARFSNEDFPGVMVMIMHMTMKEELDGKKFIANVTVTGQQNAEEE